MPAQKDAGEWAKVLEAARKEGKVVISGDSGENWRKSLVDMFMQEYPEIKVEYTGSSGRNFWPRVRQEREMGQKLWDLRAGGWSRHMHLRNTRGTWLRYANF